MPLDVALKIKLIISQIRIPNWSICSSVMYIDITLLMLFLRERDAGGIRSDRLTRFGAFARAEAALFFPDHASQLPDSARSTDILF